MKKIVGILNYGLGNLLSIKSAVEYLNHNCQIINDLSNLDNYSCILLPGVGAFDEAIKYIDNNLLREKIIEISNNNKKIKVIGICLGMQIAFDQSEESVVNSKGLGIINGRVKKIDDIYNPPLNGWSKIKLSNDIESKEKYNFFENRRVYLTHSYYCETNKNNEIAHINHKNFMYSAIVIKNNFIGLQFHPEKSGPAGLEILDRILNS